MSSSGRPRFGSVSVRHRDSAFLSRLDLSRGVKPRQIETETLLYLIVGHKTGYSRLCLIRFWFKPFLGLFRKIFEGKKFQSVQIFLLNPILGLIRIFGPSPIDSD